MLNRIRAALFEPVLFPLQERWSGRALQERMATRAPRIAFVKQDVQDDLYCCRPTRDPWEIVGSTLMRTGPVALFTRAAADCIIVRTEDDEECRVWEQRCTELHWVEREKLLAIRETIPGRPYGQGHFARGVDDVNWAEYDIVVSLDVSVPARITSRYPDVAWCYYVREPKTSAYAKSRRHPLPGQDLFLNQGFRPPPLSGGSHEIEFPYYLQYTGCFHELLGLPDSAEREGCFLEHQTAGTLSATELHRLGEVGSIRTTAAPVTASADFRFKTGNEPSTLTLEARIRGLASSRYFVQLRGQRGLWGNAFVEAVAAGALAIGDPDRHTHRFIFSEHTTARTFDALVARLEALEADSELYERERWRQQRLIDFLCYTRPMMELLEAAQRVTSERVGGARRDAVRTLRR